jgi:GT2 family glycosyltransferase
LIVDDASEPCCRDFLQEFAASTPDTGLLRNPGRRGFPYNCNEIIYNSSEETICLLNSDTLVSGDWDRSIMEVMSLDPSFAMAGPSTSFAHTPQELPTLRASRMEQTLKSVTRIAGDVYKRYKNQYQPLTRLGGFCFFFKRELIRRIGYFDERFGLGCGEEDDFVYRARRLGFRAIWVKYSYVHHFGHCTFTAELGKDSAQLWAKNKLIFEIKQLLPHLGEIVHPPPKTTGSKN